MRNRKHFSVLLKVNNITAVAYINNQGGTASKELVALAKDLWMWCLERNIHIQAQYLPGIMNSIADWESRVMKDRSDWQLDLHTILQDQSSLWPTRSGPVCIKANQSVPPLF